MKKIKKFKIENKKIVEANLWIKKYFKDASEEYKFFEFIIKGIKDNKLISNPIHILNQEEAEIEIKEPKIIEITNNIL